MRWIVVNIFNDFFGNGVFNGAFNNTTSEKSNIVNLDDGYIDDVFHDINDLPINVYIVENKCKVIELEVANKTKENIKVKSLTQNNKRYLLISVNEPNEVEELNVDYKLKNIKKYDGLKFKVFVEDELDLKTLRPTVKNGMLKITISFRK